MEPTRLGKYEIIDPLGRGGYGTVYRAREVVLDVPRAVKVLHPALAADPDFIERFRREARIAARLEHPHIVPVYELDEAEGRIFLAMKYLPGGSLKDLLAREGRLPFERAMQITRQIAQALDFAYSQPEQLVHRDVKPGNILFDADGSARLADFGFAKALAGANSASLSASGGMIGTPAYMAPEAWRNKPASPATDVYSLACVVFEMLTGQALFTGESPPEIMTQHMLDGPQFPAQWPEGIPAGSEAVLRKALAQNPEARYPSAGAFSGALAELNAEAVQTQNQTAEQARQKAYAAEQRRTEEATTLEKIPLETLRVQASSSTKEAPAQSQREKVVHKILRMSVGRILFTRPDTNINWRLYGWISLITATCGFIIWAIGKGDNFYILGGSFSGALVGVGIVLILWSVNAISDRKSMLSIAIGWPIGWIGGWLLNLYFRGSNTQSLFFAASGATIVTIAGGAIVWLTHRNARRANDSIQPR